VFFPAGRVRPFALAAFFVVAVVVAAWVIRPWLVAPIAYDAAAAVLHFQRILSGRGMEDPLSVLTTPKPLLTLVYGLLYATTHDWRAISIVVVGVWGLCVTMAAALAWRIGGILAAFFVATAFVFSSSLLVETTLALGAIWALFFWLVAGLAVTAQTPRWGVAGGALAFAALARLETFVIIGLALGILVVLRFGPRSVRRPFPRRPWLLGLGLLALPVMLLHDWLLTGDPLFWTTVSIQYSATAGTQGRLPDVATVAREISRLVYGYGGAAVLAVIGLGALARRGQWAVLVGLVALGPGVAVFLIALAARHIYVDPRYLLSIEVMIMFSAGIGISALRIPEFGGGWATFGETSIPGRLRSPFLAAGMLVLATLAAAVLMSPTLGPLDPTTTARIRAYGDLARTSDLAVPALLAAIDVIPGIRTMPGDTPIGSPPAHTPILVPAAIRPRMIVDLGLPVTRVGTIDAGRLSAAGGYPAAGQLMVIDKGAAVPPESFAPFEISRPAVVGGTRLVPLVTDPGAGTWVVRVAGP
jgi:hypothetical protein